MNNRIEVINGESESQVKFSEIRAGEAFLAADYEGDDPELFVKIPANTAKGGAALVRMECINTTYPVASKVFYNLQYVERLAITAYVNEEDDPEF